MDETKPQLVLALLPVGLKGGASFSCGILNVSSAFEQPGTQYTILQREKTFLGDWKNLHLQKSLQFDHSEDCSIISFILRT